MHRAKATLCTFSLAVLVACGSDDGDDGATPKSTNPAAYDPDVPYEPSITASDFVAEGKNTWFPLKPGTKWIYEANTDEGLERIEVTVLSETRDVWGVTATVVRDTVHLDGELVEDTWDWFAEDEARNVWYLGEDTFEYEDGEVVCSCGAWESGVDGALPGIVMLAEPKVGEKYRQEYYRGEAEDIGEVIEIGLTVEVPAGTYEDCVKTLDTSAIEPDNVASKYYCPGVGNVLEEEGDVRVELVSFEPG